MQLAPFRHMKGRIASRIEALRRYEHVRASIRHEAGPRQAVLGDNEVALVLMGRNASFYLDEVYEYHRALGVNWFMYLDNGSTDDSVARAARFENSIVASCSSDFRIQQSLMRYFSNTLFLKGGWRLAIDCDELFDFPGSDRMRLPDLTRILSDRGHTAVVAQMLDMVPAGSLSGDLAQSYALARSLCQNYSLENITRHDYFSPDVEWQHFNRMNQVSSDAVGYMFGGIRRTLFDENCCLTKHALFRMGPGVQPLRHPHVTTGVRCADFTAVLYHYKFAGDVKKREETLLREKRIAHPEARLRMDKLNAVPEMSFLVPGSRQNPTTTGLLDSGFLVATPEARARLIPQTNKHASSG